MVNRSCPKGALSPVAKVLKTLQTKLPTIETTQLIPNALHSLKPNPQAGSQQDLFLNIRARRHDAFAALFIDLEGTLDDLNARELIDRITKAAKHAKMDIVVNFEHLKHATPKAIQTLFDGDIIQSVTPYAKLRYRKFKEAFQVTLQELTLPDLGLLEEASHDA